MNKKAKAGIGLIGMLMLIYLGLGIYYHIQINPGDNLLIDIFTGGFKVISNIMSSSTGSNIVTNSTS